MYHDASFAQEDRMATKPRKGKTSGKTRAKSLTARKSASVKGGSLNTYISRVSGEKQGSYKGG
jgi:hypothetical protein